MLRKIWIPKLLKLKNVYVSDGNNCKDKTLIILAIDEGYVGWMVHYSSLYLENLEHLFCPSHSPYTSILIFCIHSFQFSFRNYDYAERSLNFAVLRVIVVWFEISAHAHAIFTALVTNREPNWLFVSIESRSRCLSITCFNLCPIKNHCNSLKIFGLLLFAMNRVHIRSAHFMEVKVWFHAACNTADVRFVCSSTKRVARH